MRKIYNDKGKVQCPVCGQFVDQEDLWTENGVTACDDCAANGEAPSDFYADFTDTAEEKNWDLLEEFWD